MAQSAPYGVSSFDGTRGNGMTQEKLHELEQYERIIRLRDAVLAGTHPAIKISPQLLASVQGTWATAADKQERHGVRDSGASLSADLSRSQSSSVAGLSGQAEATSQRRVPEINPIFLEKSEHLVRAELKLQRQRVERALREEVEQRRPTKHAPADLPSELDIADILSKALNLVPAVDAAAPVPVGPDATANADNRSDSFDNNTFYSSQHDTPDLQSSPLHRGAPKETADFQRIPESSDEAVEDIYDPPSPKGHGPKSLGAPDLLSQMMLQTTAPATAPRPAAISAGVVPGLNNYPPTSSRPALPHGTDTYQRPGPGPSRGTEQPLPTEAYAEEHPPSPLLRTHDLQPIATQPVYHAALALDSSASNSGPPTAMGTPAQVAALRHDPASATSPDSSPQGGRVPERKKSKKKKRKAERQAAEAEAVYIKPEPRSPSPMAAPTYTRPSKRARHAHRQTQGPSSVYPPTPGQAPGYDLSDHDTTARAGRPGGPPPLQLAQGEPVYAPHARGAPYPPRPVSSAIQGTRRYSGGYVDSRGRVAHHPGYGALPPQPYAVQEPPEVMYDYVESPGHYPRAVSHHISYDTSRMSHRPEATPYVGAPRPQPQPQPQRIYVDSNGREYLEPRRPTVRQSVAPAGYYREPEVIYERAPPRAVSRYAEPGHYVEGGPAYGQAYPAARRVVTQPEYVPQPYGEGYPGEPPLRSMMPPDARAVEPPGPDFGARMASVRPPPPPPGPGEYASPQEYGSGPESRPETVVGGYGAPPQAYAWDYEGGPAAGGPGYYAAPARGAEEMAYIEPPPEVVYAEGGHEELYR